MYDRNFFSGFFHTLFQFFGQSQADLFVGGGVDQIVEFVGIVFQIIEEGFRVFLTGTVLYRIFVRRLYGVLPPIRDWSSDVCSSDLSE